MKKGFVVSAVLYPLLIIALALIMGVISMSDNRRKILDNMKLEVSEENETDPEMTNSNLYYKMKALEEAYAELNARFSEEYFDEIRADYEKKIAEAKAAAINSSNTTSKNYTDSSINTLRSSLTSDINAAKTNAISTAKSQAKLEAFPVGSIYITIGSANPSTFIGGSWEKVSSGRVLMGATGSNAAGSTIDSGLPNIAGSVSPNFHASSFSTPGTVYGSGALTGKVYQTTNRYAYASGTYYGGMIMFDASKYNSIYGRSTIVQPPAFFVNIWKRTA